MKRSTMIIGTACVALLLFSGWKLAGLGLDYHKGTETYRSLSESYTTTVQPSERRAESAGEEGGKTVDFDRLRLANADIAAWLYSPGTAIDYPVVQGEDNDFYLRHMYSGEYNQAGTLFLFSEAAPAAGAAGQQYRKAFSKWRLWFGRSGKPQRKRAVNLAICHKSNTIVCTFRQKMKK